LIFQDMQLAAETNHR